MTKQEAIIKILRVLKNAMLVMSPAKTEALNLAKEHDVTVQDLIEAWADFALKV